MFTSPHNGGGVVIVDCNHTPIKPNAPSSLLAPSNRVFVDQPSGDITDDESFISFVSHSSSDDDHDIFGTLSESSLETEALPSTPICRKMRTRTMEVQSPLKHVASTERVRRNTDSMLEDVFIADKLKRRLGSRREQSTRRTISYTGLSDFIMKSITEGALDAVSAAMPTDKSLSHAANIAFRACMAGYFENLENEEVTGKLKLLFVESLERIEFRQGDFICKQNEKVDKLFVIEEGAVQFSCGGQVAGNAGVGSIIGELSLVYGIPAPADVKCITPCVILWTMDALSFRRIQAVVAKESLKASSSEETKVIKGDKLRTLRRQCSSFLDLQEESTQLVSSEIPFEQLQKVAIIGRGTFGSVYIVKDKASTSVEDRYYSLKCMSKSSIVQRENQKRVLIEKHALQESSGSPFVISLFGTYQDTDFIYFLTDFIQGGNLMGYMIKKDILTHDECIFFTANIVAGLSYLHCKGFVHRDIKPENCLIDSSGCIKICDFGMAKRLPSTVQLPSGGTEVVTLAFTMCGTPEFMAPEFVLSTGYSKGIDWWALGCILVEMYCGRSPFEFDGDLKKTFKKVCLIGMGSETFIPPKELDEPGLEGAKDFAQQLLSKSSERLGRHCSRTVKEHAYFSEIDFGKLRKKLVRAPYLPRISHAADSSHFDVEAEQEEKLEPFHGDNDIFKDF